MQHQQYAQGNGYDAEQQQQPPFLPLALGKVNGGTDAAQAVNDDEDAEHNGQKAGHYLRLCQREDAQPRRDDAAHQHERRGKAGAADAGILDQADNAGDKHHNTKNVADPEQTGLGHDEQQHTDDDIRDAQQQHSVFDIAQHSERLLFTCRLPA